MALAAANAIKRHAERRSTRRHAGPLAAAADDDDKGCTDLIQLRECGNIGECQSTRRIRRIGREHDEQAHGRRFEQRVRLRLKPHKLRPGGGSRLALRRDRSLLRSTTRCRERARRSELIV